MPNALLLSPTVDTAGLGIALKRAFDAHGSTYGDWHARHVRRYDSWLHYDCDIQWDMDDPAQSAFVGQLWRDADALLIIEQPLAYAWGPRKPTVVWHLGTFYRRQPETVSAQCRAIGALEVADMPDLIVRAPHLGWLPDLIDPVPLLGIRKRYRSGQRLRIAHAPTDKTIKRTDIVEAAISRLQTRGYEFDYDRIEGVPNAECLERKAAADIFIDDMGGLGIGLNALECWSMGIPVVSAIADPRVATLMREQYGGSLPFLRAEEDTLADLVAELLDDETQRQYWAEAGSAAIARYHTPAAVVERTVALFEQVGAVPA